MLPAPTAGLVVNFVGRLVDPVALRLVDADLQLAVVRELIDPQLRAPAGDDIDRPGGRGGIERDPRRAAPVPVEQEVEIVPVDEHPLLIGERVVPAAALHIDHLPLPRELRQVPLAVIGLAGLRLRRRGLGAVRRSLHCRRPPEGIEKDIDVFGLHLRIGPNHQYPEDLTSCPQDAKTSQSARRLDQVFQAGHLSLLDPFFLDHLAFHFVEEHVAEKGLPRLHRPLEEFGRQDNLPGGKHRAVIPLAHRAINLDRSCRRGKNGL